MADNLTITQGSGTSIAADDIGGVLYQRIKLVHGADGVGSDASNAAPLPVTLAFSGANTTAVLTKEGPANAPSATTMQSSAVANGSGTSLTVQGYSIAVINIVSSVAMSGGTTVNFEASTDDTTWVAIMAEKVGTSVLATSTTSDGDFRFYCAGYKSLRARISGYSAGTISVLGYVLPGTGTSPIHNLAQLGGVAIDTNSGSKSAGTQRMVIATDQPNLTTPLNTKTYVAATVLNGKKTVTTAGTRVALASTTACRQVIIRALGSNTGTIYVGDSSVASTNGHTLVAGESVGLEIADLASVYIDSSVNGEGVTYLGSV